MKQEKVVPSEEVTKKVQAYVQKNYKDYEDKVLYIYEYDKCFTIANHKDGSPLILGKGIIG